MYLGRGRAGSARLLQTTNCLNSTVKECVAYINSLLQADVKQGSGSQSCICCEKLEKLSPTKPGWTPPSRRAPVFCKRQRKLLHPPLTIPPLPQRWNLVLKGFRVVLSQFLCPGLFPSCAVTSGCQQATTADTDGSPGLWWLPYVTSLLQVCAAFFFFFLCFSFHLSSLSLFGSLKWPEQGGRGECRRGWKGSNMMPINTFQCRARIQAQLEFYLFTEWLLGG